LSEIDKCVGFLLILFAIFVALKRYVTVTYM
jgi:hypothetical protein